MTVVGADDSRWTEYRAHVCHRPGTIYLNSGSYSPLPLPVFDRAARLRRRLAESPTNFYWREMPALLDAARGRLAEYLHCATDRLLLLPNATHALNIAVRSLHMPAGSELLITDHEYGAIRFLCRRAAAEQGFTLREVSIPYRAAEPAEFVATVASSLTSRTRVLLFSHVTSPTGLVLPARALCQLARERKVATIVDGAHAPGMVPLDLADLGADLYAGNCHKWLMAPTGAAFLYVDLDRFDSLQPVLTSWGWDYDRERASERSGWGASFWARNFEFQGTQDRTALCVLPELFDFRAQIGESAIHERVRHLAQHVRDRLGALGFESATPAHPDLTGAMTAFEVPAVDPVRGRDWFWREHQIEVPFTTAVGQTFLRVSTAWFNTRDELDRLAEALACCPFDRLSPP